MALSPESTPPDDELLPEYDLSKLRGGVRGKYFNRYQERLRFVRLEPDVATAFANEAEVNAALREYLKGRQEEKAPA
jgi:hypothetical protein